MKKIVYYGVSMLLAVMILLIVNASAKALASSSSEKHPSPQQYEIDDLPIPEKEPIFPFLQQIPSEVLDIDNSHQGSFLDQPEDTIMARTDVTVTLGAWRNLRVTESYLRGVSLLPPSYPVNCVDDDQKSKGWIVGDGGVILSYCNGVWDHAIIVESLPTTLFSVQALTPQLAVAVGEEGAVLMYLWDNIAQNWVWTKSPIPVGDRILYGVSMAPDGTGGYVGWAVGEKDLASGRGTLIKGTITPAVVSGHPTFQYTWQNQTEQFQSLPQVDYYFSVQMLSATNGWAVGGNDNGSGVILHWNGSTWSVSAEIPGEPFFGLNMRSDNDGWVVGNAGVIYHYNGNNWQQVSSPTSGILFDVDFAPDGTGWAVGMTGNIIKYSGGVWTIYSDMRTDAFDFWGIDFTSSEGWMVGFHLDKVIGGQILQLDDGIWYAVSPPTDNQLNDISIISDNEAWAVGAADEKGGTIIYWDGSHWQRWFQKDLPIPSVDLYAIDMTSSVDGWAAGDPPEPAKPAVMLHWDGNRWAQPRYDSPINVRINDLDMLDETFGWAVANDGNAVAKYDINSDYWSANHTRYGTYYQLRGTSIVTATNYFPWDAWAVGTSLNPATGEYFMHYSSGSDGWAWDTFQQPSACPATPLPSDGGSATILRGIDMMPNLWGYAVGNYKNRMSIYSYNDAFSQWETVLCEPEKSPNNPSAMYSVDIIEDSGIAWFGGYYYSQLYGRKVAYIVYKDAVDFGWAGSPIPLNGKNIYDRPVHSVGMSSDTMGWAVGDPEDGGKRSILYQYPFPNFTLKSIPDNRSVRPGEAAEFTIEANSIGGFSADVSLLLGPLPLGMTGNIAPTTVNASQHATIDLQTSQSTPLGVHQIPVLGYAIFRSGDVNIPVWRTFFIQLTVTNHPLYSVEPSRGPAGTVVSINGANFGSDPGAGYRSTAQNHVTWAGVQLPDASITSWSDSEIKFTPPDNPDLFLQHKFPLVGEIIVTAGGTPSNSDLTFQIESHISTLTSVVESTRILITLTGTSFGSDPGVLYRSTSYEHVSLGGVWIPTTDVKSWNNNQIQFYVPINAVSQQVIVTSNGYESNAVMFIAKAGNTKVYLPMLQRN